MLRSIVGVVMLACSVLAGAQPITTGSLIGEMGDLDGLTRFPAYKTVQFSSYDRRSSVPGGPEWFANSDGFGSEPIPNFEAVLKEPGQDGIGEYLICDIQQPGAIVRTWTATIEGKIRVYLDGSATPVYDGPAADFCSRKYSTLARAAGVEPKAAFAFEQRYADYFPIPFAKSCRVVWVGNWRRVHFYHLEARLYPAGTAVTTFEPADMKACVAAADAAALVLARGPAAAGEAKKAEVTVGAGQRAELVKFEGAGVVSQIEVKVAAEDLPAALRGTVLRIHFDGYPSPQVCVPIGDFFGAAPGVVPYESLPMSVKPDGTMVCRFRMPFEKGAVIAAENRAGGPATVSMTVHRGPYTWDDRAMHFRARWRADHDLVARADKDAVDMPYLLAHGRGVYVGTALYIMSPCPVPTAGGNWWGEGDEKIFVDGGARAAFFGTGSEDYFNYAWSECDIFQYPYFAQPICTGPETRGNITNNRWHVLDAIPFESSLSFFMELYSHSNTPHLSYTRTAYWYARPGAYDDGPGMNDADLRVPALPAWTVKAAGGAAGAMIHEAEASIKEGAARVEEDVRYSAGKLARLGGAAAFTVNAEKAGKHQIVITCTSGPDGAAFSAAIDGTPLTRGQATRVEVQTAGFERLVNIWFDAVELTAGAHTLSLSEASGPVGIDFVWVKPAK